WDTRSHRQIAASIEHTGAVQAVAFSGTGLLASGGDDGSVRVWDAGPATRSLAPLTSLLGPTDRVLGLAFSPNGGTIAAAGLDGAIGLWNVSRPPDRDKPVVYAAAAFGPRGRIATAGRDRTPLVWDTASGLGLPVLTRALITHVLGGRPRPA